MAELKELMGTVVSAVDDGGISMAAKDMLQRLVMAADGSIPAAVIADWATEAKALPSEHFLPTVFHVKWNHGGESRLYALDDDSWMAVRLGPGEVSVLAVGRSTAYLEAEIEDLRVRMPKPPELPDDPSVMVTFWSLGTHGPTARRRRITVPWWKDIRDNYPVVVQGEMDRVVSASFVPGASGQLLLWHGNPGTGKTFSLRAMLSEWRTWCTAHYVTDPEVFFGERAGYMLEVILNEEDEASPPGQAPSGASVDPRAKDGKWRLLILEDSGELMSADATSRSGQGLSRLLNVVDGLIGQGLRLLVLITTNEEIKTLHAAVSRPGRCASNLLFGALSQAEARDWLHARHAATDGLPAQVPLSDLYSRLAAPESHQAQETVARVGFGR